MDIVSNIVGIVVLLALLLGGWFILTSNQLNTMQTDFKAAQQAYQISRLSSDFDSILKVTEPKTSQPLAMLIGDSIYYGKETLEYGQKVDVKGTVEEAMDAAYGKDNYYLTIVDESNMPNDSNISIDSNASSKRSYSFSLGTEKTNADKFAFERSLALPNNLQARVRLVVYGG